MLPTDEHARRDDLLLQSVTAAMAAQTETIRTLTAAVNDLREKVHSMETLMAESGARERGKVENLSDRVARLEKVNGWFMGIAASVIAAILIFLFTNVLRTGVGPK